MDYQGWDPSSIFNGGGNENNLEQEPKAQIIHPAAVSYSNNSIKPPTWVGDDEMESKGTLDETNASQSTSRRYSNPPNESTEKEKDESTKNSTYDRFVLPFPRPDENLSLSLSEPTFTEGPPGTFLHPSSISDPPLQQQQQPEESESDEVSLAPEVIIQSPSLSDHNNREQDLGNALNSSSDGLLNTSTLTKAQTKATTVDHTGDAEEEVEATTTVTSQQGIADAPIEEIDSCKTLDNGSNKVKEDLSLNHATEHGVPLMLVFEDSCTAVATATTEAVVAIPTAMSPTNDHKGTDDRPGSSSSRPSAPALASASSEDIESIDAATGTTPRPRPSGTEGEGPVEGLQGQGPVDLANDKDQHPDQRVVLDDTTTVHQTTIAPASPTPSTCSTSQPSASHSIIPPSSSRLPSSSPSPPPSSSKRAVEATEAATDEGSGPRPQSLLLSPSSTNIDNSNNNSSNSNIDDDSTTNDTTKKPPPPPPPKGAPAASVRAPGQGLAPGPPHKLAPDRSVAYPANMKIPGQPPKPGEGRYAVGMMDEPPHPTLPDLTLI